MRDLGIEWLKAPIVEDQHLDVAKNTAQAAMATIAARERSSPNRLAGIGINFRECFDLKRESGKFRPIPVKRISSECNPLPAIKALEFIMLHCNIARSEASVHTGGSEHGCGKDGAGQP
jgi:hypothetical protein